MEEKENIKGKIGMVGAGVPIGKSLVSKKAELLMAMAALEVTPEIYSLDNYYDTPKIKRGTPKPVRNSKENPKIGRNEPCPCGSGLKYKKCCINKKQEENVESN